MIAKVVRIDQAEPVRGPKGERGKVLELLRWLCRKAEELGCLPEALFRGCREVLGVGEFETARAVLRGAGSRWALTPSELEFVRGLLAGSGGTGSARRLETPRWDRRAMELWWRGVCVRRYRHDAANQRAVLNAFQAQEWRRRLVKPLPRVSGINVKVQLRWTIRGLNEGQNPKCVRFCGDGTGLGVCWEAII
jgi:hypothetical protein